jgi:hypothetical protein
MRKIHYLANLNVRINSSINNYQELQKEIAEISSTPKISGLEIRLEGENLDEKSLDKVAKICDDACDKGMLYLHLSNYGLAVLDNRRSLVDYFNLVIGHYGRHENVFGQLETPHLIRQGRHTHKSHPNCIRQILARKKLVIENGSRIDNCLPIVYNYAKSRGLNMALDIGHFILGTLEHDEKTNIPHDALYKYVKCNKFNPRFETEYLHKLGSKTAHLHIHGVKITRGELIDHVTLSPDTIRGLQIGMIKRLLENADIVSATVELRPEYRTKENIVKSIENFESMLL